MAFQQACETLAYAHGKGVIHRDLTPNNLIVAARGAAQVIDWGLARVLPARPTNGPDGVGDSEDSTALVRIDRLGLTDTHNALGTPAYMAPEQADGGAAEAIEAADVFGLGGILCFILTGQPPYSGRRTTDVMLQAKAADLTQAFDRLAKSPAAKELIDLAKSCLAPEAADRPAGAAAIATVVADCRERGLKRKGSWWKWLFGAG